MGTRRGVKTGNGWFWWPVAAVAVALVFLTACGDKAPGKAGKKPVQKVAKEAFKAPTVPSLPMLAAGQGLDDGPDQIKITFNPKTVRNPFRPFIKMEEKKKKRRKKDKLGRKIRTPRTPLERYTLQELKLVGILWSEVKRPEAIIEDPAGKGYTVRPGTHIGDQGGRVTRITKDAVLVEARTVDVLGEVIVDTSTLTLHKNENEVTP